MGMMDISQVPQEVPQQVPQQGLLGGLTQSPTPQQEPNPTTSHGNYNGVVQVDGNPIEVRAGIAQVDGQPYFVSDNGKIVMNHQGQLVGHIENGKFAVVTEEYARKMRELGYA